MNQIPPTTQLQHIPQLDDPPALTNALLTPISAIQSCCPVLLRGWIPPIPPKLHKKITEGHYVDMAELYPEHLEVLNAAKEDHSKSLRPKLKGISSIYRPSAFMWPYYQKISPIMFQVSWHTNIYYSTATLTSSSSIQRHMTVSFARRPPHVLVYYGRNTVELMPHRRILVTNILQIPIIQL